MSKLTPVEQEQRSEFVLQRLKRGFSFREVQQQFKKEFQCHPETARRWVNWACDRIAEEETPAVRKRTYNVIVEMYHDQIVSFQNELLKMENEIKALSSVSTRRNAIYQQLNGIDSASRRELLGELSVLPDIGHTTIASLIEAKTRIRERMYRVMTDLARLRGFGGFTSDWRSALNTLLDNNLLPPRIAEAILNVIEDLEGNIRSLDDVVAPSDNNNFLEGDDIAQDELGPEAPEE